MTGICRNNNILMCSQTTVWFSFGECVRECMCFKSFSWWIIPGMRCCREDKGPRSQYGKPGGRIFILAGAFPFLHLALSLTLTTRWPGSHHIGESSHTAPLWSHLPISYHHLGLDSSWNWGEESTWKFILKSIKNSPSYCLILESRVGIVWVFNFPVWRLGRLWSF